MSPVPKSVMIEVGLNEAVERDENPWVPISPEEIAADILACAEAGASIIHFHARDPETGEQRCCDTDLYRAAMRIVRDAGCDVLMYPTYAPFLSGTEDPVTERFGHVLELADDPDVAMRIGPLDMGSLNLVMAKGGKLLPGMDSLPLAFSVYANPVPLLSKMLAHYDSRDLVGILAVFEPGHLRTIMALLDTGLGQRSILKFFLSGRWLHGPLPDPDGLDTYLRMLDALRGDREIEWFCVPSGLESPADVDALVCAALQRGGHVRVGIGDNPIAAAGRPNRELVEHVVALAAKFGRAPASPRDVLHTVGLA